MQPTIEILRKINQNSNNNKHEVFTRLYRYLLRPDIYYIAYKNLYANSGAATKGVNDDTADGFSESKVDEIIKKLTDGSYQPKPTRRVYIAKANGKLRPLGIPTFTDKLIQEVLRMILEAVYEPVFLKNSHGFRPNKSCHTALTDIKYGFPGTRWFIEGDIKGCFDNINHTTLIGIINTKIKDAKLIQLIWKFLKSGYVEEWKYNKTHSGTPQGGIVSPILANIYLHELDKFVDKLKADFDKPISKNVVNPEYDALRKRRSAIDYHLKKGRTEFLPEYKKLRAEMLKLPAKSQTDKIIKYVRYADDFLLGVKGSKADCERIKSELKTFLRDVLKMELSEEKTLITHSAGYARFLGYDIKIRRNNNLRRSNGIVKRTLNNSVELNVPLKDKIERFLFGIKAVEVKNGALFPVKRNGLVGLTDFEIVTTYNAELRGICNYYSIASNFSRLDYFAYLMEYSCLKTLAAKYKGSMRKVREKFNDRRGGWAIPYETKSGRKRMYFAKYQDCKAGLRMSDIKPTTATKYVRYSGNFEERLKANSCQLCGIENAKYYEIHHVNKVKNLKGKELWERIMITQNRKTIILCRDCHKKIHGKK